MYIRTYIFKVVLFAVYSPHQMTKKRKNEYNKIAAEYHQQKRKNRYQKRNYCKVCTFFLSRRYFIEIR